MGPTYLNVRSMKYIVIAIIGVFVISSCSILEEEEKTLPPATQEGLGTFGCYINGELFVETGTHFGAFHEFSFQDHIMVFAMGAEYEDHSIIENIFFDGVDVDLSVGTYDMVCFEEPGYSPGFEMTRGIRFVQYCVEDGEFIIDRFDSGILSARFSFTMYDEETGDTYVVTEGRFDTFILL